MAPQRRRYKLGQAHFSFCCGNTQSQARHRTGERRMVYIRLAEAGQGSASEKRHSPGFTLPHPLTHWTKDREALSLPDNGVMHSTAKRAHAAPLRGGVHQRDATDRQGVKQSPKRAGTKSGSQRDYGEAIVRTHGKATAHSTSSRGKTKLTQASDTSMSDTKGFRLSCRRRVKNKK